MKPEIIIWAENNCLFWVSNGWNEDEELMKKARQAIDSSINIQEAITNLEAAGFTVKQQRV